MSPNHAHTVAVGERVVGDREVLHRDGARDELGRAVVADEVRVAVDERDVKILVEELEVLGGRGAPTPAPTTILRRGRVRGLGGSLGPGGAGAAASTESASEVMSRRRWMLMAFISRLP